MKSIGKYLLFLGAMFVNRTSFKIYIQQTLEECIAIGVNSIFIVVIISTFMGAVTAIQTAYNLVSPLIHDFVVGTIVRDMTILELAPTITAIVFAGKVGSSIAGQLGTMRITEQIDALEVMGINANAYLVLPKISAAMFTYPLLVIIAGALSIYGGLLVSSLMGLMTPESFIYGLRFNFNPYTVRIAIYKSLAFSFLISSISAYKGFYTRGGAREVGQMSTSAVTNSCIAILLTDYLLAQLFLK